MILKCCKKGSYDFLRYFVFVVVGVILLPNSAFCSENLEGTESKEPSHAKSKFNVGETIIEHVVDAYQWHIMDVKGKAIAIDLPVILIDNEGIHVFSSAHFEHGHQPYKGYAICHQKGMKKGKIVKIHENGEIDNDFFYLDLSITKNVLSLFIGIAVILAIFLSVARNYKKRGVQAPKGIARAIEPLVLFVRNDIARPCIGKKSEKYLPFLLTMFFFIFINNLLGLVPFFPGGANLTGNISITAVLAAFTFIITNVSGNRDYWKHIVNPPGVPWWLKIPIPLIPLVELIGVFTKPIVLAIRLFANITAGHIIALGFICLIFIFGQMSPALGGGVSVGSVAFYIFMGLLELLVAFIQAFVFTLLSAIYIGLAVEEHHHKEPSVAEIK
ncbi:MAG: F0F1 ATP synthase subunit A [Bacteroidales bacterium]|jgi:F-type H+-transporting ATPase subunit a|nr:F0F1 ATP synthase subunit A [Bacteroidales bacterium]